MHTVRFIAAAALLAAVASPGMADPDSGTLTPSNTLLTYTGGPYTGANPSNNVEAEPDCDLVPNTCDDFALTIDLPVGFTLTNPDHVVLLTVEWPNAANDFDVYIQDPNTGLSVIDPAATSSDPEIAVIPIVDGITELRIRVLVFSCANETFTATLELKELEGTDTSIGEYVGSNDVWSCNTHLEGLADVQGGVPFDHGGDGEPSCQFAPDGRIWLSAIGGIPTGSGLWTSDDACGQAYEFRGAPDQVGGGDSDIHIAPEPNLLGFHNIYISSLLLAGVITTISYDGGETFVNQPVSDVTPVHDRQWNAAHGANTLYLSYREGGGGFPLFVVRSDNGGVSFSTPFPIYTDPEVNPAQNGSLTKQLGNMATDRRNHANNLALMSGPEGEGNVYHGFIQDGREVYVAVSKNFGVTWDSRLVFDGGAGASFDHIFSWVAVDRAGNVYTTWSDNSTVFYSFSTDQAASWSTPVRVNAGGASRTAIFPNMAAGSEGRVVFSFYGHDLGGTANPQASWKVFVSRVQNALDPVPIFEEKIVSDRIFHQGEVCQGGLGCACCRELLECFEVDISPRDGSALVIYGAYGAGGSYITRQIAGESSIDGLTVPDRSGECPSPENECVSDPIIGNPCLCPGVMVVNDIDDEDSPPAPTADTNIRAVTLSEPYNDPVGDDVLVFSVQVEGLDPDNLPPNTFWRIFFTVPGGMRYVRVLNCAATGLAGDYGHFEVGSVSDGPLDAFDVRDDGTICMWLSKSRIGSPGVGVLVNGVNADCRFQTGNCPAGPAAFAPLDVTNSGQYALVGNDFCTFTPVLVSGFDARSLRDGVEVSWSSRAVDEIRSFTLHRSGAETGLWSAIYTVPMGEGGVFTHRDAPAAGVVHYRLDARFADGTTSELARTSTVLSSAFAAGLVGANPARSGEASVSYTVPEPTKVRVDLFDVAGRHVRGIADGVAEAGTHVVSFARTDAAGRALRPGVYMVKVQAGAFEKALRLVVLE